jgi:hypothetical protein
MHCTFLIWSHTYAYVIDHTKPEPEELPEQVQVEDANTDPEQGKPWCI